jgi:Winged helix DNA-binding domain
VTNASIAARRMYASGLIGRRPASVEEAVRGLGAVQSQDYPGAAWGLAQRVGDRTLDAMTARYDRGSILRTHAMRPTWHFVLPEDIRWLQALTGPRVHARNASMYRRLEIDDRATWSRCRNALAKAVQGGHEKTRAELSGALGDAGVEAIGQRLAYIVMRAELDGLICSGAFRGKQFTYALLDEKAPPVGGFDREAARADLVHRYFASHGPALVRDFVWWSGLTTSDAKAGIASVGDRLRREEIDGKEYLSAADASSDPRVQPGTIHLLPNYDEYLGSYADYEPIFDPSLPRARTIADVLGVHIVLRDGLVVGGWRRATGGDTATVTVTLLLSLTHDELGALEQAAAVFGRFLGLPVDLRVAVASTD